MSPVSSSLESQLWQTDSTLVSHEPSSSKADTKPEIIMAYQHSMQFGSDSTISPALKGRIAMFERSGKPKIIINFFCGFAWKWLFVKISKSGILHFLCNFLGWISLYNFKRLLKKELEIAKIRNQQSLQFTLFLEKLGDPLKKGRIAYGLQLDSCKRSIQSR